jgi:hypothetical protein
MSSVHKYNTFLNQAKKICGKKNPNDIYADIAKQIFNIYREVSSLRDKEIKRYRELLLDNTKLSEILDNILSESEILIQIVSKSKKLKKELSLTLLDDIIKYIENNELFNNDVILNKKEHMIPLVNLTDFIFGSKEKFVIEKSIMYKCSEIDLIKIRNFILEGDNPDPLLFNINEITDDIHVRYEFNKMVEDYHS